jgi:hypothetical protein
MFWGYNLIRIKNLKGLKNKNQYKFYKYGEQVKKRILDITNGVIDATKVQDDWFPDIDADIFISHSHADKSYAESIAMWLEDNFDLNCFIDSDCWGNKDSIIEELIKKSKIAEFEFDDIVSISDNVSNILQGSLVKMIDRCDGFIFLNTTNSITPYNVNMEESKTYSPWLYFELLTAKYIKQERKCWRNRYITDSKSIFEDSKPRPKFEHTVYLNNLLELDANILNRWKNTYKSAKNIDPFDVLERIILKG